MDLGDLRGKRCNQGEALATGAKEKERGNGPQEDIWVSSGHLMATNRHSDTPMRSLLWNRPKKPPLYRVASPWSPRQGESAWRCTSHSSRIVKNESFSCFWQFGTIERNRNEGETKANRFYPTGEFYANRVLLVLAAVRQTQFAWGKPKACVRRLMYHPYIN
jgi:hypothetical protein